MLERDASHGSWVAGTARSMGLVVTRCHVDTMKAFFYDGYTITDEV